MFLDLLLGSGLEQATCYAALPRARCFLAGNGLLPRNLRFLTAWSLVVAQPIYRRTALPHPAEQVASWIPGIHPAQTVPSHVAATEAPPSRPNYTGRLLAVNLARCRRGGATLRCRSLATVVPAKERVKELALRQGRSAFHSFSPRGRRRDEGAPAARRNHRSPLTPPSPLRGEGVKRRAHLIVFSRRDVCILSRRQEQAERLSLG